MKHPEELKTKFLELRAYSRISEELGVSKPTLIQWGKAMAEEIADLQAAERELVREKLLGNFEQWLGRQVHHFNRLDEEFGRRELKYSPTESVFRMMMASRKLLDRHFFEHDKPSRRRRAAALSVAASDSEGRAPSSPSPQTPSSSSPSLLPSLEIPSEAKSNKTERSDEIAQTRSRNANDLQQSASKSFDFCPPPESGTSLNPQRSALNSPGSAPLRPCVDASAMSPGAETPDSNSARVETQNPAKTLPFACQNSGVDNRNLSPVAELSGRAAAPSGAVSAGSQPSTFNSQPSPDPFGLESESVPINPYESTREWLERQGIKVSTVPKGARIITAA